MPLLQGLDRLGVAELKARLRSLGLPLKGRKAELLLRLQGAASTGPADAAAEPAVDAPGATVLAQVVSPEEVDQEEPEEEAVEAVMEVGKGAGTCAAHAPVPGTAQLDGVASAQVILF